MKFFLKNIHLIPEECLFIDDIEKNVRAAEAIRNERSCYLRIGGNFKRDEGSSSDENPLRVLQIS